MNVAFSRLMAKSGLSRTPQEGAGSIIVEPSDEELCRRIGERDHQAFELLVERYQNRAARMAGSILGNETDGRDISQEAFIRVFEAAHRFDGRSRFSTWFYRILVNLCIDHQRRNRWWRKMMPLSGHTTDSDETPIDPPSDSPSAESLVIHQETGARFLAALKELSPSQRAAVLMQVQDDLTSREIAAVLGCSESTARVHVHRGVARLSKLMKEDPN